MVFNKIINGKESSQSSTVTGGKLAPLPMDPNLTHLDILDRIELRPTRVYFRVHGSSVPLQWGF